MRFVCVICLLLMSVMASIHVLTKRWLHLFHTKKQILMVKRQAEVIVDGTLGRGIKPEPVTFP